MDSITTKDKYDDNEEEEAWLKLMSTATPPIDVTSSSSFVKSLECLTKLNLPGCGLSSFPSTFATYLPNLSILFCSNNQFKELPPVVGLCPKLQMISFKSNGMVRIHPDGLRPQLRWLILTDNNLTSLPKEIGRLPLLQKLMLSGNRLTELPSEMSNCRNLELVRLASNQLSEPPMALLQLPNLAWVGLSDNPFLHDITNTNNERQTPLLTLDDPTLEDEDAGEILGSGASGVIRKAYWKDRGVNVAVKAYVSNNMTSDGKPDQERMLSLAVSTIKSPNLIRLYGQTPSPKKSLVMELLHNYFPLAGPPGMETCSRDVYSVKERITTSEDARKVLRGLLRVMVELHGRGIMHGDFYGHNILISTDKEVESKLSDFGSAFFYDTNENYGAYLERIELRAFTILVDEIISLVEENNEEHNNEKELQLLKEWSSICHSESTTFLALEEAWDKTQ